MQASNCKKHPILVIATALLLYGLLFISYKPPEQDDPLRQHLKQLRDDNDLTNWIYTHIQWAAKDPGTRAGWLQQAMNDAWRIPASNEEVQAWQDLLINEGYDLLIAGDIVRSTDAYTAAFQWARQHAELADEAMVLENILKPLGNNYTRLGDYEQALFIHRKSLAVAYTLNDPSALAGTLSNLANTTSNMGRPAESLDYCRQGLHAAQPASPLAGLLLSEQADALLQLDQPEAARESINKSISILEKAFTSEGTSWLLIAYQQAGDIYEQEPAKALIYYQKALAMEKKLSRQNAPLQQRQKAKLFQRMGALYARINQPALAIPWMDQCLTVLIPGKPFDSLSEKDCYGENTLMDLLFTRAGLAAKQDRTDIALRLYSLCFAAENDLRRELVTGASRERAISDSHLRYETAIGAAWDAWKKTGQPARRQAMLEFMEGSKARLLLEEVLRQRELGGRTDSISNRIRLLEKALIYYRKEALQDATDSLRHAMAGREKQVEWDLAQLHKNNPIPKKPSDIQNLPSLGNRLLRNFFAGSQTLYIVECGQEGIRFADKLDMPKGWQDSIRCFNHTWFETGAGNMINAPATYYKQAYTIYNQLFGAHPLEKAKEYILLPDGTLSLLPMDALVTKPDSSLLSPASWPFLIRQASISYAWSILTLQEQLQTPGNNKGFSGFFLSDNKQLPTLTNIEDEEKGIAHSIHDGAWYRNEKATAAAFRQALQESAVIHISAHAFSGKDTAQTPHIELYDQPFYLFELKEIRQHPSLVVLSACRTGDGRMVTGEGVQSLARAFTAQGTGAVVAGWWNVNDAAASRLMQEFYKGWNADDKNSLAASLRTSKLDWLDDPKLSYQHKLPYYWAALNYSGNPQPLQNAIVQDHSGYVKCIIAALIAATLLVVVLRLRRYRSLVRFHLLIL